MSGGDLRGGHIAGDFVVSRAAREAAAEIASLFQSQIDHLRMEGLAVTGVEYDPDNGPLVRILARLTDGKAGGMWYRRWFKAQVLNNELTSEIASLRAYIGDAPEARLTAPDPEIATAVEVEREAWQPIETAPRDGTVFWAAKVHPNAKHGVDYFSARWTYSGAAQACHNLSANKWSNPTHWRPLPAPPTTPTEEPQS